MANTLTLENVYQTPGEIAASFVDKEEAIVHLHKTATSVLLLARKTENFTEKRTANAIARFLIAVVEELR